MAQSHVRAAEALAGSLHTKARAATIRRDLIAVVGWYSAAADGRARAGVYSAGLRELVLERLGLQGLRTPADHMSRLGCDTLPEDWPAMSGRVQTVV